MRRSTTSRAPGRALLVPAMALALAGCPGDDAPPDAPPRPQPMDPAWDTAAPAPGGVTLGQSCTNAALGFRVDYPDGWVVNGANGLPPCSAFDPEDASMPEAAEIPRRTAVVIHQDAVAFERVTDFDGDFTVEAVSLTEESVDGRRAIAAVLRHTGEGLYPEGDRHYAWFVDRGGRTLMAMTHDVAEASPPSFPERRQLLDAMMRSLRLEG